MCHLFRKFSSGTNGREKSGWKLENNRQTKDNDEQSRLFQTPWLRWNSQPGSRWTTVQDVDRESISSSRWSWPTARHCRLATYRQAENCRMKEVSHSECRLWLTMYEQLPVQTVQPADNQWNRLVTNWLIELRFYVPPEQ